MILPLTNGLKSLKNTISQKQDLAKLTISNRKIWYNLNGFIFKSVEYYLEKNYMKVRKIILII